MVARRSNKASVRGGSVANPLRGDVSFPEPAGRWNPFSSPFSPDLQDRRKSTFSVLMSRRIPGRLSSRKHHYRALDSYISFLGSQSARYAPDQIKAFSFERPSAQSNSRLVHKPSRAVGLSIPSRVTHRPRIAGKREISPISSSFLVRDQWSDRQLRVHSIQAAWLPEALQSLHECVEEALEEGFDPPNDDTLALARGLLEALAAQIRQPPDVQPLQDASVAVDFRNPVVEGGVMFVIEPGGAGVCYYRTRVVRNRVRTSDVSEILNAGGWYALDQVDIA